MKVAQTGSLKPNLNDSVSVFLGINGTRVILIFPTFVIMFMIFFNDLGAQYSGFLETVLNQLGIPVEVTERKLSQEIWLLAEYKEYLLNIPGTIHISFPLLLFQKIQFFIVMLCMALGLHLEHYKKWRYLAVAGGYWAFVTMQDIVVAGILYILDESVDVLFLGATMVSISAYVGSIMLLYTIFHTADLPKPVSIKPKIKRSMKKYYYVLSLAIILTSSLFYFLVTPLLQAIEFNIAIAILVFTMFNLFRFIAYGVGYLFTFLDKPIRDYSYTSSITVIIPARNEEKVIAKNIECVNNAAGNYKGSVELIVVNDKSTDNTVGVTEKTILNCKNLKGHIISGPGKGKSAAVNLALSKANGELTLILDADTVITNDAISELVPYFVDPEVGGVGCHVEQKNEIGLLRKMFSIELLFIFGLVKPGQQGIDAIMVIIGGSSMYRTSVLKEVGGWGPIRTGDDGDMTLRVARYGYKIIQYKEKTLARSEIFPDLKKWFIQRTRWYIAFFYTHARNRLAVRERQGGLRATYQMPLVYAGAFTRFTTLLFTEITILMAAATYIQSGFIDAELAQALAIVINPMVISLFLLSLYYKKLKIIPYFILWPAYSFLQELSSFRALMVVMGDEGWESKAAT